MTHRAGEELALIDGHSLAFRAFHALPATLATRRGELTNASFGFTSMLLSVLRDFRPSHLAVAFDVGRTFRHERFAAYKATRAKMPEELGYQVERIKELLDALRVPIFTLPGYEADDILGALSRQAAAQGMPTLLVTGDSDAFQLIDSQVRVLTSRRTFSDTVIYDEAAVRERYGLSPAQLIDYKALVGDKSDNIPGVAGVGEKTATQLLQQYGSVAGIYDHLDAITAKRAREALAAGRDAAFLSRELVTIVRDAPIQLDLEACRLGVFDRERVTALFRELDFRTLLDKLPAAPASPPAQLSLFDAEPAAPAPAEARPNMPAGADYLIVDTPEKLERLVAALQEAPAFAFDTETTSTEAMRAELVGLSFAASAGRAFYAPVGHSAGTQLTLDQARRALGPLLADAGKAKLAHNAIYDLVVLRRHGFTVAGAPFDTMLGQWLLDPAGRSLGLKSLAFERLNIEMTPITDLIGSGKKQTSMADAPIERVGPYAAADADMTLRLAALQEPELREKKLWPLFAEVEMPLVDVLADMEMAGVRVDPLLLGRMGQELEARMAELETTIQQTVGYAFNLRSTKQLSDALFVHLGLPTRGLRKTESGEYSTAADILETLRTAHPVVEMILEHRQWAKLKSTYIDTLPALINPLTGRIHTSFNQAGTVTGRVSSSDPNLQNIPIRTAQGRRIREAFVAPAGCQLLSADYSQVELRILAHIAGDPAMLAAFARDEDIHAFTAASIFHVPLAEVTPEQRRIAKTTNFAIVYGVTGYGLSQQTSLSPQEATEFIKGYFEHYPRIKAYLDESRAHAAREGYVETLLGRRRYFPELQSAEKSHAGLRAAAERAAINMPIQGTAADIIKIAMIRLRGALAERGLQSRMVLQVHDELVLEVPAAELPAVAPLVKATMEGAYPLQSRLKVDCKAGDNWGIMTPLAGE